MSDVTIKPHDVALSAPAARGTSLNGRSSLVPAGAANKATHAGKIFLPISSVIPVPLGKAIFTNGALRMLRIGVTGHTDLSPSAAAQVRDWMRETITRLAGSQGCRELRGVSCLAPGADMIFAEIVLELGGSIEVVVPSRNYRRTLSPKCIEEFDRLITHASTVDYMSHRRSGVLAFRSANAELLRRSNHLIAVWNGAAPPRPGGTGEVVGKARAAGIPVEIIWPHSP